MSEQAIQHLTEAVERLALATDRLAAKIDFLVSRRTAFPSEPVPAFSEASSPVSAVGKVIELQRTPFPTELVTYCALWRFRGLEEGPGSSPNFCFALASEKLSSKEPGVPDRVGKSPHSWFLGLHCRGDPHCLH